MPLDIEILGCAPCGDADSNLTANMQLSVGESVSTQLQLFTGIPPNNTVIDLTGFTIKMQINFPTPLLLNTGNGGIVIPDALNGIMQINIADTVSNQFVVGVYPYDIFTIDEANNAMCIMGGVFTVLQSVTPIP